MENASKALLMAAGILVGVLILALMVTLFATSSSLSKSYDNAKQEEAVQQFNANFTKYVREDITITIHDVVTITNFANKYGVKVKIDGVTVDENYDYSQLIKNDVADYYYNKVTDAVSMNTYKLKIEEYSENTGYVSKIKFIKK